VYCLCVACVSCVRLCLCSCLLFGLWFVCVLSVVYVCALCLNLDVNMCSLYIVGKYLCVCLFVSFLCCVVGVCIAWLR